MANRFDELARILAGNISRREALQRLGAGLAGTLMLSLGLAKDASAQSGQGGSACVVFCKAQQAEDPEAFEEEHGNLGRCVSACQRARNACRRSGGEFVPAPDAEEGNVGFVCCPPGVEPDDDPEELCEPAFPDED